MIEQLPPCFCCGRELGPAFSGDEGSALSVPWAAVRFTALGNYGSRVHDCLVANEYLQVNVCDDCLVERSDRVLCVSYEERRSEVSKPWEPPLPTD